MKLWLQRHAPVLCAPGLCYGATDLQADPAATQAAAAQMARVLPAGVRLWTSPLARCVQLARAIEVLRPDVQSWSDSRLAEMDFGAWEGQRWSAIPQSEMDAWMADFADYRTGGHRVGGHRTGGHRTGGHGIDRHGIDRHGESTRGFMERVQAAWDDWRRSGADAGWITHAGVMRAIERIASGQGVPAQPGDWPSAPIAFGAWRCVELDRAADGR